MTPAANRAPFGVARMSYPFPFSLLIASAKASLVALFFMHLRSENRLVWTFALVPIFFLVLIIGGTLSDTLFR
jgi:cytochrome c oxidase subunit 4